MALTPVEVRYANPYRGDRSAAVLEREKAEASGSDVAVAVGGLAVGYVAYSGLMLAGAIAMIALFPLSLVFLGFAAMDGGKKPQRYYGKFEV
jgi:hypothetical protein